MLAWMENGYGKDAEQAEGSGGWKPWRCSCGVVVNEHQRPRSASVEPLPLTARTCQE
jgi:hypothetical protein